MGDVKRRPPTPSALQAPAELGSRARLVTSFRKGFYLLTRKVRLPACSSDPGQDHLKRLLTFHLETPAAVTSSNPACPPSSTSSPSYSSSFSSSARVPTSGRLRLGWLTGTRKASWASSSRLRG